MMTIEPGLPEMLLFAAVVREGGFTAAARRLGIAKQSVSDRVARLEGRLGVRLLERTTRRVRPTDAGARYFERCHRIATEVDEANQEVRARQAEPTGLLRITAPYLFGRRFLGPIITDYLRRYPRVRLDLVLGDRRANLIEDGFDLAIRVGTLADSSLSARLLGNARISTVVSPAFLAAHRLEKPNDLEAVDCIGIQETEEWSVRDRRLQLRPNLVVNDLEIACNAVVAGLGAGQLPELLTREHLNAGRLVRVFEGKPQRVPVFVVYPSRQFLAARVRAFIDALVAARSLDDSQGS